MLSDLSRLRVLAGKVATHSYVRGRRQERASWVMTHDVKDEFRAQAAVQETEADAAVAEIDEIVARLEARYHELMANQRETDG